MTARTGWGITEFGGFLTPFMVSAFQPAPPVLQPIVSGCTRLNAVIFPATWGSSASASGFLPRIYVPVPSGFVIDSDRCEVWNTEPAQLVASGYVKDPVGKALWDF